jgi:hypothetical protein
MKKKRTLKICDSTGGKDSWQSTGVRKYTVSYASVFRYKPLLA